MKEEGKEDGNDDDGDEDDMIGLTMIWRRKKSSRLRSRRKMIVNKNRKISQLRRKLLESP